VKKPKLLPKDSPIKDAEFVSTLYQDFVIDAWLNMSTNMHGETEWMVLVVRYLDTHGVEP
jgi:hypothetical protein